MNIFKVYDYERTECLGVIHAYKAIETKKAGTGGWSVEIVVPASDYKLVQHGNTVFLKTKEQGFKFFRIRDPKITDSKITFKAYGFIEDLKEVVLSSSAKGSQFDISTILQGIFRVWTDRDITDYTYRDLSEVTLTSDFDFTGLTVFEALEEIQSMYGVVVDQSSLQTRITTADKLTANYAMRRIAYGENLQALTIERSTKDYCNRVYAYTSDGLEYYMNASSTNDRLVSKSMRFDIPTRKDNGDEYTRNERLVLLQKEAEAYLNEHKDVKEAYTIKSNVPQDLGVFAPVKVCSPLIPNGSIEAIVTGYTYNVISERVLTLTFGNWDSTPHAKLIKVVKDTAHEVAKTDFDNRVDDFVTDGIFENLTVNKTQRFGRFVDSTGGETYALNLSKNDLDQTVIDFGLSDIGNGGLIINGGADDTYFGKAALAKILLNLFYSSGSGDAKQNWLKGELNGAKLEFNLSETKTEQDSEGHTSDVDYGSAYIRATNGSLGKIEIGTSSDSHGAFAGGENQIYMLNDSDYLRIKSGNTSIIMNGKNIRNKCSAGAFYIENISTYITADKNISILADKETTIEGGNVILKTLAGNEGELIKIGSMTLNDFIKVIASAVVTEMVKSEALKSQ